MQRKKKRSIIFELYSIPIRFRKQSKRRSLCKELYLVSYSIPLSCMVVLLLGGIVAINPSLPLKSSAVTIQDEWVVKENKNDASDASEDDSNLAVLEDTSEDDNTNENIDNNTADNSDNPDAGIMPFSIASDSDSAPTPSISITVSAGTGGNGGGVDQVVNAFQGGSTVYRSHNVTVKGTLLKDYSLVLTGPTNLTMPSGASSSTSTVGGAGGKTGSNMATNTWGYAWGNTTDTDSSMTYNSLSASGKPLDGVSIASDKSLNFTKKLVFAAKFGDAAPGNYTTNVTLSAVATPVMTMSNITTMQDMTPDICAASSVGATVTLKDSRDGNSYNIIKHKDNHCWMQQNLRLGGTTTIPLDPNSTDLKNGTNWILPAAVTTWDTSDQPVVQTRVGSTSLNNAWQTSWGNYYSWCAATAGTCSEVTTAGAIASGSICPKGWALPTGNKAVPANQFYTLFGENGANIGVSNAYDAFIKIQGLPYSFPAAGFIFSTNGSLSNPNYTGMYWTNTACSGSNTCLLYFNNAHLYPAIGGGERKNYGSSVRCVAAS